MARKWNCSKRKRHEARNAQPLKGKALERSERSKARRRKALLRTEIKELMHKAYALWLGVDEPYPSRFSGKYMTYHYIPETDDKRNFILTYIGSRVWDQMDTVSLQDLEQAQQWALRCRDDMRDTYHNRRFWRNIRRIAFCGVLVASTLIYSYFSK
jgi:hypothetical protein